MRVSKSPNPQARPGPTSTAKDKARAARGLQRRKTIHKSAQHGQSSYTSTVYCINKKLLSWGTHLSSKAASSIERNMELVEKGKITSSHASHREAMQFFKDATRNMFYRPRYALQSFAGFVINTVGGIYFELQNANDGINHPNFLDQVPPGVPKDWQRN